MYVAPVKLSVVRRLRILSTALKHILSREISLFLWKYRNRAVQIVAVMVLDLEVLLWVVSTS